MIYDSTCSRSFAMANRFMAIVCWLFFTSVYSGCSFKSAEEHAQEAADYQFNKEYDKAIKSYTKAIDKEESPYWLSERGEVYVAVEDYEKALADFERALELKPDYAAGYVKRSYFYSCCPVDSMRDGAKALEDANKAITYDRRDEEVQFYPVLAAAYAELGDFDKAVYWETRFFRHREQMLGGDPDFKPILDFLWERVEQYRARKPNRYTD